MTDSWLKCMPRTLDYPDVGADAILAGAARAYPDRLALREGDATLTFAELHDSALRVAAALRDRGIEPGDAVALHMPNSMWFIVAYYGVLCAGAAAAPINPAQPAGALVTQLEDCDVRAVITHPANAAVLKDAALPQVRFTVVVPTSAAAPGPDIESLAVRDLVRLTDLLAYPPLTGYRVDPGLVAHLQLTGGTTGRSKAVRVLHRNLVANVLQVACWRSSSLPTLDGEGGLRLAVIPDAVTPHSIVLGDVVQVAVAPLFHGLGLVGYNLGTLVGSSVVMAGRFEPEALLSDIERYRVTDLSGAPAMFHALLSSPSAGTRDLSSMRLIWCGAGPIDSTALRRMAEVFPRAYIAEGYGLSEATMGVSGPPLSTTAPIGSVGVALFDTEIEIRSVDERMALLGGDIGEVWVRGPQVGDGYQGDEERTAEQFVDGWLRTGDLGYLDEHGYLFLVGRVKDMLIYKGYNVYPEPLEEILCSHPAIAQACVVGLPTAEVGEIPVAFVVTRPGAAPEKPARDGFADELISFVAERVAPYHRIRALHVVDALPLTPTGKVLKTELRARLQEGHNAR